MTKEEFLQSNYFKILLPVVMAALLITIWRRGIEFGQWLHTIIGNVSVDVGSCNSCNSS